MSAQPPVVSEQSEQQWTLYRQYVTTGSHLVEPSKKTAQEPDRPQVDWIQQNQNELDQLKNREKKDKASPLTDKEKKRLKTLNNEFKAYQKAMQPHLKWQAAARNNQAAQASMDSFAKRLLTQNPIPKQQDFQTRIDSYAGDNDAVTIAHKDAANAESAMYQRIATEVNKLHAKTIQLAAHPQTRFAGQSYSYMFHMRGELLDTLKATQDAELHRFKNELRNIDNPTLTEEKINSEVANLEAAQKEEYNKMSDRLKKIGEDCASAHMEKLQWEQMLSTALPAHLRGSSEFTSLVEGEADAEAVKKLVEGGALNNTDNNWFTRKFGLTEFLDLDQHLFKQNDDGSLTAQFSGSRKGAIKNQVAAMKLAGAKQIAFTAAGRMGKDGKTLGTSEFEALKTMRAQLKAGLAAGYKAEDMTFEAKILVGSPAKTETRKFTAAQILGARPDNFVLRGIWDANIPPEKPIPNTPNYDKEIKQLDKAEDMLKHLETRASALAHTVSPKQLDKVENANRKLLDANREVLAEQKMRARVHEKVAQLNGKEYELNQTTQKPKPSFEDTCSEVGYATEAGQDAKTIKVTLPYSDQLASDLHCVKEERGSYEGSYGNTKPPIVLTGLELLQIAALREHRANHNGAEPTADQLTNIKKEVDEQIKDLQNPGQDTEIRGTPPPSSNGGGSIGLS